MMDSISCVICWLQSKSQFLTIYRFLPHRLVGLLQVESFSEVEITGKKVKTTKYGHCNALTGSDPLPPIARDLLAQIKESLCPYSLEYLAEQKEFFDSVTDISAQLKAVKIKEHRRPYIANAIKGIVNENTFTSARLYLPTDPNRYTFDYFFCRNVISHLSSFCSSFTLPSPILSCRSFSPPL
jgi:hypothetical protein